jgi:hypothetical protein
LAESVGNFQKPIFFWNNSKDNFLSLKPTIMKMLFLFVSLVYIGFTNPSFSNEPVDKVPMETLNEVFLLDDSFFDVENLEKLKGLDDVIFINDFTAEFEKVYDMENDCLDGCAEYGKNCSCGVTIYFQWCPCPWFEDTPQAQGDLFCARRCNIQ